MSLATKTYTYCVPEITQGNCLLSCPSIRNDINTVVVKFWKWIFKIINYEYSTLFCFSFLICSLFSAAIWTFQGHWVTFGMTALFLSRNSKRFGINSFLFQGYILSLLCQFKEFLYSDIIIAYVTNEHVVGGSSEEFKRNSLQDNNPDRCRGKANLEMGYQGTTLK